MVIDMHEFIKTEKIQWKSFIVYTYAMTNKKFVYYNKIELIDEYLNNHNLTHFDSVGSYWKNVCIQLKKVPDKKYKGVFKLFNYLYLENLNKNKLFFEYSSTYYKLRNINIMSTMFNKELLLNICTKYSFSDFKYLSDLIMKSNSNWHDIFLTISEYFLTGNLNDGKNYSINKYRTIIEFINNFQKIYNDYISEIFKGNSLEKQSILYIFSLYKKYYNGKINFKYRKKKFNELIKSGIIPSVVNSDVEKAALLNKSYAFLKKEYSNSVIASELLSIIKKENF